MRQLTIVYQLYAHALSSGHIPLYFYGIIYRMKKILAFSLSLLVINGYSQVYKVADPLAHTFSIVARDSITGEMGVAVQSHWFSVGTTVSWAEAGVGAVATQSFVNKSFGIRGLELLKSGLTAQQALDKLLSDDEGREVRQVAIVDAKGNVANFTGKNCIDFAGDIKGDNFSVQS
ncbi:MAG: Zn-dependent protease, partial [Flaviaesturariibacter sp.]|nr:Zn-dependent protease [Flaviaesturariibacter sp.]